MSSDRSKFTFHNPFGKQRGSGDQQQKSQEEDARNVIATTGDAAPTGALGMTSSTSQQADQMMNTNSKNMAMPPSPQQHQHFPSSMGQVLGGQGNIQVSTGQPSMNMDMSANILSSSPGDTLMDDENQSPGGPTLDRRDRRASREWDASQVPPSQFQRRKGSIFATPSSRDGQVSGADRDKAYHDKLKEKGWHLPRKNSN